MDNREFQRRRRLVEPVGTGLLHQTDHLNTPRLIANSTGTTVWRWDNTEPFGDSVPNGDPGNTGNVFDFPLGLSLYYRDKETGNLYASQRDAYSPGIGRFPQFDPIGLAGGSLSPYVYVNNNPLGSIDLTGLQVPMPVPVPPIGGAGGSVGGNANIASGLNNLINKIIEACTPDDKPCPPCRLIDGTIVPVGTIGYRFDPVPPGRPHQPFPGDHYNLYKANQYPAPKCDCFWQPAGAALIPPPGSIPILPFAN